MKITYNSNISTHLPERSIVVHAHAYADDDFTFAVSGMASLPITDAPDDVLFAVVSGMPLWDSETMIGLQRSALEDLQKNAVRIASLIPAINELTGTRLLNEVA